MLEEAADFRGAGILFDTWDKRRPAPAIRPAWIAQARAGGLLVALAGGLDEPAIGRLAPLAPDIIAVRGAACSGGDRQGVIDPIRVARLAAAAHQAAADPPPAWARAVIAAAASSPERMQSGIPTPSK